MFFEKLQDTPPTFSIDGVKYEFTTGSMTEIWNCKEALTNIYNYCEPDTIEMNRDFSNYMGWKKDLVKALKEWDKVYAKHSSSKGSYKEMAEVHSKAMKPLSEMIEANHNFQNLERMIAAPKSEVPEFRSIALEEQFCEKMTTCCQIFKDFGTLNDHFDIR
jgi:hypothetical protein